MELTIGRYGHLFPGQAAQTVAMMPDMGVNESPQNLRATGTGV
jgi:hypothetical protein